MSERDNELLSQYLDGELGAPQVLELECRLAAEPALQVELERLQAVDNALRSAFNTPGATSVPPGSPLCWRNLLAILRLPGIS